MKLINFILFFLLFAQVVQSQEEKSINKSKHEMTFKISYGRTPIMKTLDDTLFHVRYNIVSADDNLVSSIVDTFRFKNAVTNQIGILLQYNRIFNKHIFLPASLNINYSFPNTIDDYNKSLFSEPIHVAFEAFNSVFVDVGLGGILWNIDKPHLRLSSGFILGHFTAIDMMNPIHIVYDNTTIAKGFEMEFIKTFMLGGYVEATLNFPVKKNKMDFLVNYKYIISKGVGVNYRDYAFNSHNLGLGLSIKL